MITLLLLAMLQAPQPLGASPVAPPAQAPAKAVAGRKPLDPNERVCHKDIQTGHLISGSTCHTRAEWDDLERRAQSDLQDRFHHGGCIPGANC